jgi:hypothetical protein
MLSLLACLCLLRGPSEEPLGRTQEPGPGAAEPAPAAPVSWGQARHGGVVLEVPLDGGLALDGEAAWRARAQALELELRGARARGLALETELARLSDRLIERELSVLRVQRELAQLGAPDGSRASALGAGLSAALGLPEPAAESAALPAAPSPDVSRGRELVPAFNALLRLEGVRSFDLLELGRVPRALDPKAPAGAGPVVLRRFDSEGRLSGHLVAKRLSLSGSRSAHTLSLILEDGHSATAGRREPFPEGRLVLPLRRVDPAPFVAACGELFSAAPREVPDDGRYPKAWLEYSLNRLLALDGPGARFRLVRFEGVAEELLRGVELAEVDADGRELRRLFADRLAIRIAGERVSLLLEQGASVRAGEPMPFLEGRLWIHLPRADVDAWRASGLPGTAAPAVPSALDPAPAERR